MRAPIGTSWPVPISQSYFMDLWKKIVVFAAFVQSRRELENLKLCLKQRNSPIVIRGFELLTIEIPTNVLTVNISTGLRHWAWQEINKSWRLRFRTPCHRTEGEMGLYDVPLLHMFRFQLGHDAEVFLRHFQGHADPKKWGVSNHHSAGSDWHDTKGEG